MVIRGTSHSEGQPQTGGGTCADSFSNFAVTATEGDNSTAFDCGGAGNPNHQVANPTESVAVPGTSGLSGRPVLQSAALVPGPSNQIDFTFSLPISAGDPSDLVAVLANGQEEPANGETVISANTVRATFSLAGLQQFTENLVKVSAFGCATGDNTGGISAGCTNAPGSTNGRGAVQSVNPSAGAVTRFNLTGGVAVGDNAGAFATGYTTGPDARSVTFDNTSGTVTVQMDSRVDPESLCGDNPGACGSGFFELLDRDRDGDRPAAAVGFGRRQLAVPVADPVDLPAGRCPAVDAAADQRLPEPERHRRWPRRGRVRLLG